MSVKSTTAYSLYCDGCGGRYEGNDWTIWEDRGEMTESAIDSEWSTDNDLYHCPTCPRLTLCDCCGKPADDGDGERDGLCQHCYDSGTDSADNDLCSIDHAVAVES